ncbi:MAG: flippase, partial [Clostridium sp.]|nr:flippase [Clostridium sp.]
MKILKNYLYNLSYQLLAIILPLITVPYISKVLGAEGVGKYSLTFANTQYFVIFGMIGLSLYGNRQIAYVRNDSEKLKETFFSIYTVQVITTAISLTVFLAYTYLFN